MNVTNLRPVVERGDRMRILAYFDLELNEDVRLYGLRLIEAPDGNRIIYAPQHSSRRTATFSRPLQETITKLASTALEAVTAHGSYSPSV